MRFLEEHWPGVLVAVILAALVGVLIWFIPLSIREQQAWVDWCISQDGHVDDDTKTITTYDAKGRPTFGSSTTYYCLSDDGRILDIR